MEWFEEENFWHELYPFMFPESRMEKAEEDSDSLIKLTGITEGDILDLCCGPGRFSIAMARRGFTVTGVDRTESLLEIAGRRTSLEDLSIEWVLEDMRSFVRPDSF
ncbi:MAG: class I SAM-dependent methyltransferase, partial [Candidatus Aegiribacteria sp.]|nr:class I SAM-dependent methyltransferase [Candidatus Aegiribacteria sp.]